MKQESNAQKKFEIKILPIIVACIVITISVIIAYFTIKDVKSYPTEEIEPIFKEEDTREYATLKAIVSAFANCILVDKLILLRK